MNSLLMDMNRLRYFQTIAKLGSFARASEVLRISQPALSKAMKILEGELSRKLFTPSGRGVAVTEEGRALQPRVDEILSAVLQLKIDPETPASARVLRIVAFEVFSTYFMEHALLGPLRGWELVLHESIPGELERLIATGIADYGITYMPVPERGLDFVKIRDIEMGIYGIPGRYDTVSERTPFVVPLSPVTGSPSRVRGLDGWPEEACSRRVAFQVTLLESALGICRRGQAVGYFPKFVVDLQNRVSRPEFRLELKQRIRGVPVPKTSVYLVKRKGRPEDPGLKKLASAVRTLCY